MKQGTNIELKTFYLGTSVIKFNLPIEFIDSINKVYDENSKELKPHNDYLAGKIAEENEVDEIFDSSLDSSGTDEFMRILHFTMSKENVFVISHKGDTLMDKFPRVMKFEKYKNFTRMAE